MEKVEEIEKIVKDFEKEISIVLDIKNQVYHLLELNRDLKTKKWMLNKELLAYYNYTIKDNLLNVSFIETINSWLYDDYDLRFCTNKFKQIPWLWKILILDSILLALKNWINIVKIENAVLELDWFYNKVIAYLQENQFIKSFYYEWQTENYKNIILEI